MMNLNRQGLQVLFGILFFLACSGATTAQQCPTTPEPFQMRTKIKHRKPPTGIHINSIELKQIFDWALPANISDAGVRASNKLIDGREGQAFQFEGDLWRALMEMNDCDLHL